MIEKEMIPPKVRDAIVQSLRAGVVPRVGQKHFQVGRAAEVKALLTDVERLADGGSAIRFIIGEFGSGKTFFLYLIRAIALEKKLVTAHADLTSDRCIHSTAGHARALHCELMRNLSTRIKPDGEALSSIVERFVNTALEEARKNGTSPSAVIHQKLSSLSEMVGGYDFAEIIAAYWKAHDSGDEELKASAVRWLRGEFSTRTDARNALGIRTIIEDEDMYDHLKLFSRFVRLAGYGGFLVCLDEMVKLYQMVNTRARNSNYEKVHQILNDCLQGNAEGLGFLFSGTPEFLMDTRRGIYSSQDLQSHLAENTFARDGLVDYSGPVIRLSNLTPEDVYVLLGKLRHVYAGGDPAAYLISDDGLHGFLEHCSKRIGDAYFRTPRNTIRAFLHLLAVLEQNPRTAWKDLIGGVEVSPETNPDLEPLEFDPSLNEGDEKSDGDLASFKL
jgi:hypothetical protein